jgi:hypothetical protein
MLQSFSNLTIHKNAYYGSGAGDMVKYKLKCHGNETDIVNCRHDPISSCTGNSNVGINCCKYLIVGIKQ